MNFIAADVYYKKIYRFKIIVLNMWEDYEERNQLLICR